MSRFFHLCLVSLCLDMPGWKDVKFTNEEILKLNSRLSGFYRMMCGEGNSTGHFEACIENKTFGFEDMVKNAFIGVDAANLKELRL